MGCGQGYFGEKVYVLRSEGVMGLYLRGIMFFCGMLLGDAMGGLLEEAIRQAFLGEVKRKGAHCEEIMEGLRWRSDGGLRARRDQRRREPAHGSLPPLPMIGASSAASRKLLLRRLIKPPIFLGRAARRSKEEHPVPPHLELNVVSGGGRLEPAQVAASAVRAMRCT